MEKFPSFLLHLENGSSDFDRPLYFVSPPYHVPKETREASLSFTHRKKKESENRKKLCNLSLFWMFCAQTRFFISLQPLLFAGFNEDNSLVVVERPWVSIMEALPPTLQRKKYGT